MGSTDRAVEVVAAAADPAPPAEVAPLTEADLLNTMDGMTWAKEFCRLTGFADESLALAWFCNAIMTGYDEANRRRERELAEARAVAPTNTVAGMKHVEPFADAYQFDPAGKYVFFVPLHCDIQVLHQALTNVVGARSVIVMIESPSEVRVFNVGE